MPETVSQSPVLWEYLLGQFQGKIALDREGPRDWRTSQCMPVGQEEVGFDLLQSLDIDELYQAFRRFYEAQGLTIHVISGYCGWMRNSQGPSLIFIITAMGWHIEISIRPM